MCASQCWDICCMQGTMRSTSPSTHCQLLTPFRLSSPLLSNSITIPPSFKAQQPPSDLLIVPEKSLQVLSCRTCRQHTVDGSPIAVTAPSLLSHLPKWKNHWEQGCAMPRTKSSNMSTKGAEVNFRKACTFFIFKQSKTELSIQDKITSWSHNSAVRTCKTPNKGRFAYEPSPSSPKANQPQVPMSHPNSQGVISLTLKDTNSLDSLFLPVIWCDVNIHPFRTGMYV